MRYRVALLLATATMAACSDSPTGSSAMRYQGAAANQTLEDYIQQQIDAFLPKGFEDAVDARWSTVQRKKNAGDMAGAVAQLNSLAGWITRKTNDITPPVDLNKSQAATILIVNMSNWVYQGPNAPVATVPGPDAAVAVAPAGQPFLLQTPSMHAGVTWDAGTTSEDRVVVLAQNPTPYTTICSGPLVTTRCQYPLFYQLHTYPHTKLNQPGRFAVCMVETGDRRPIEYPQDEAGSRPVDDRLRIAHDRPANPSDYTPGSTVEGGIEILPKSTTQTGTLIDCDEPNQLAMNTFERALYRASKFLAQHIAPKNAYAWDAGAEHDFSFTSNFNGVDPQSQADLAVQNMTAQQGIEYNQITVTLNVANVSRRNNGAATATSQATTLTYYRSADAVLGPGDTAFATAAVPALAPDDAPLTFTQSVITVAGNYHIIASVAALSEVSTANNVAAISIVNTVPPPGPTGQQEQPLYDNAVWGIGGGPNSQEILAQVFTAGITGTLYDAAFPVSCSAGSTLVVEVRGVTEGIPNAEVYASQSISATALMAQDATFKVVSFSSPTFVSSGNQYALVLKTANLDTESCGILQGPVGDPYLFGDGFFDARPNTQGVWVPLGTRKDLPFKTTVISNPS